jgi:hypothetical protein
MYYRQARKKNGEKVVGWLAIAIADSEGERRNSGSTTVMREMLTAIATLMRRNTN